jgi:hypothetical protein
MADDLQEWHDRFYTEHGPCCAGCDHWQSLNSTAGECRFSKLVSGTERLAMLGITYSSLKVGAGHVITPRDHVCAHFKDDFDWSTLTPWYLRKIGRELPKES